MATLSCYQAVIKEAIEQGVISHSEEASLTQWREAPEKWGR